MTIMEPGSEILKVDEVGRVRMPPEKREAMLAEFNRSGMTGAQFARFVGVRYSTLMYWLQKRRKEAGPAGQMVTPRQDHPGWWEARVEGEVPKSENVAVEMGGGVRMLVGNRAQAALAGELLRAMRTRSHPGLPVRSLAIVEGSTPLRATANEQRAMRAYVGGSS